MTKCVPGRVPKIGLSLPYILRNDAVLVDILRRIYGDQVTEPVDIFLHDFATNPYFYGNIDVPLVGVNSQTFENFAAPVGRLYFSGSGTSAEFTSILQGAYYSGIDAANAILEDIHEGERNRCCCCPFVLYNIPLYTLRNDAVLVDSVLR